MRKNSILDSINAYLEEAQDPDKVLDIFVRVNSAGTQLSYSDLLLSMATNQWSVLDAREEVRSLVAELNGETFNFTVGDEVGQTACMAFGMERIALALINAHGPGLQRWPVAVRSLLGG